MQRVNSDSESIEAYGKGIDMPLPSRLEGLHGERRIFVNW